MILIEQALRLHQAGQLGPAAAIYLQILAAVPEDFDALQLLGALRTDQGDPATAVPLLERALAQREDAAVRLNLGRARRALGQVAAAEAEFRQAVAAAPDLLQAHLFLGHLLRETGRLAPAAESYTHAAALAPGQVEPRLLLGQALHQLGRLDAALESYRAALALAPGHVQGRLLLADALVASGQLEPAIEIYRQLPGLPPAQCNLGAALRRLGRHGEALDAFDQALAGTPGFVEAWYNRGVTLRDLGRDGEAETSFRRVLALAPEHALAESDLALILLRRGAWAEGWRHYEARWRVSGFPGRIGRDDHPQWRGEAPLAGRRLRIAAEQGLGDTIQFCRYARLAAAAGGTVELAVRASLVPLLAGQLPGVAVVDERAPRGPTEMHCPLLSLPLALDAAGPVSGDAYLAADPARVAAWQARLGAGFKVGLVWSGSPLHGNDRNRSMALAALAGLAELPGLRCFAVQKQWGETDRAVLAARGIPDLGEELGDFAETAALYSALDLIISVDTAPAHLAGALGRPVWILLPRVADWRWGSGRADTPWYASARLFRQTGSGWGPVLQEVSAALTVYSTNQSSGGSAFAGTPAPISR